MNLFDMCRGDSSSSDDFILFESNEMQCDEMLMELGLGERLDETSSASGSDLLMNLGMASSMEDGNDLLLDHSITSPEELFDKLINSKTDPVGKFLRKMKVTYQELIDLELFQLLLSAPRKRRNKYGPRYTAEDQSEDAKIDLNRQRNREHAQMTRTRKRIFNQVRSMCLVCLPANNGDEYDWDLLDVHVRLLKVSQKINYSRKMEELARQQPFSFTLHAFRQTPSFFQSHRGATVSSPLSSIQTQSTLSNSSDTSSSIVQGSQSSEGDQIFHHRYPSLVKAPPSSDCSNIHPSSMDCFHPSGHPDIAYSIELSDPRRRIHEVDETTQDLRCSHQNKWPVQPFQCDLPQMDYSEFDADHSSSLSKTDQTNQSPLPSLDDIFEMLMDQSCYIDGSH